MPRQDVASSSGLSLSASPSERIGESAASRLSPKERLREGETASKAGPDRVSVSAIVVNWNGAHHLETCLPSLIEQSYDALEVIVVDNGSTDDSEAVVRRWDVKWVPLGRNAGLAAALNRGAEVSQGNWLLFLNNDMRFDRHFVRHLAELAKKEGVFAIDASHYDWEGKEMRHMATFLTKTPRGWTHSIKLVPGLYTGQKPVKDPTVVFQACAANMMVRREMFSALGGFDARMPAGYEDTDLCWRAWLKGWKTVFSPWGTCWHRIGGSGTSSEGMAMHLRGNFMGRLIFATKLLPALYVYRTWLHFLAGFTKDIWKSDRINMKIRFECLRALVNLLPALFQERARLYREVETTPSQALAKLLKIRESGLL